MPADQIIDTQAHIETPENVRLTFRLAGPGTRLGAYLVDLVIRIAVTVAMMIAIGITAPFLMASGLSIGLMLLGMFLIEWFYGCVFEGFWSGRTPGKWLMGLRVIKDGGYPISFFDAMLRNLLRAADGLPVFYGAGLIAMLATRRMQRLGDLLAGTIVVREQREHLRRQLPFLRSVPLIPRVQMASSYRPSDRTLDLIERFFLRRGVLMSARADEIAVILARPVAERLGYQGEPHEAVREPSKFLLRVLRTFTETEDQPARAAGATLLQPVAARQAVLLEQEP
jgi:uncharacterized RDD family membrane protein YckC